MELYVKRFNELSVDDLYAILKARSEVFVVEQNINYVDQDGRDQYSFHVYIKENEKVVAYLRIIDKGIVRDDITIGRVLSTIREKGYGKEIVAAGINVVKEMPHAPRIFISAQSYLLKFYEEFGFRKVSEEYIEEGLPHTDMILDLKR